MKMRTTKDMKAAIEKMQQLYDESDRLFDTDEDASDKAYEAAWKIADELTETIVRISKGMINKRTAAKMVHNMPDRLIAICDKF